MTPADLLGQIALSDPHSQFVAESRQTIEDIIDSKEERLMVVAGPCSIHDGDAAVEYARRLRASLERVSEQFYIVMRVYFEKPRTTVGWKGLINDPALDDSFAIARGLEIGSTLLRDILALDLPTATEAPDPITPQYLHDLICWSAIGAHPKHTGRRPAVSPPRWAYRMARPEG